LASRSRSWIARATRFHPPRRRVALYRELTAVLPDRYIPAPATSLSDLGNILSAPESDGDATAARSGSSGRIAVTAAADVRLGRRGRRGCGEQLSHLRRGDAAQFGDIALPPNRSRRRRTASHATATGCAADCSAAAVMLSALRRAAARIRSAAAVAWW
jgi:hypothetical protein